MSSDTKPSSIAFFDFDKTILTVDSGPIYGVNIYREGVARLMPSLKAAFAGVGYTLGLVKRRSLARLGVGEYEGLTAEQLATWMKNAYPRLIQPHLSKVIVDRINFHKSQNHLTAIVSASPPFFAVEAARDLGIDFVFGSEMLFVDGVCTGTYAKVYLGGDDKRNVAEAKAKEYGLTLDQCWFYTDHVADLALMEAVGNPIAVGPEDKLREIATTKKWTIIEH